MTSPKLRCGHFRTHWTVVSDPTGTWSIRYCNQCRNAVESRQGRAIAEHHQRAALRALSPQEEL